MQVLLDGAHDTFISGAGTPDVKVERVRTPASFNGRTLQGEWGLSLYLASTKGTETKRYLLDFGYTGDALNANLELLKIDLTSTDALILSHGHLDHVGGLLGFLKKHRDTMKADLKLYLGGEDAFCQRVQKQDDGSFLPWGRLDRSDLKAARVQPVLSELPIIVEGHAFTTGAVPRVSMEKVLPNSFVVFGEKNGAGCATGAYAEHHFTPEELSGTPMPDQHLHEHATCFMVGDRGLVVITSCGHGGIVNTLKRAQAVTGVEKIHALCGGFHLAPAQQPYTTAEKPDSSRRFPIATDCVDLSRRRFAAVSWARQSRSHGRSIRLRHCGVRSTEPRWRSSSAPAGHRPDAEGCRA